YSSFCDTGSSSYCKHRQPTSGGHIGMCQPSCRDVTKGIAARVLFGIHGLVAVSLAVLINKNYWYCFLAAPILPGIVEGVATIKYRIKWNWAVPCIFIYLCMIVPAVLLVEDTLDMDEEQ
ncbi:unnamed protein product, partial [Meganyctiphanes norvegica]